MKLSSFRKNKQTNPKIEFFTEFEPLLQYAPKPASHFYPEWFKAMAPSHTVEPDNVFPFGISKDIVLSNVNATIKRCPGVISLITQGYIMPLWSDYVVQVRKDNIYAFSSNEASKPSLHYKEKHFNEMPDLKGFYPSPLKFSSPWKIKTAPGWSVLVLQPYYHFEQRFVVTPGVIDTDTYHNSHVIAFFKSEIGDYQLKMGMPFVQVIPFQRKALDFEVRHQTAEDTNLINNATFRSNRFFGKNKSISKK